MSADDAGNGGQANSGAGKTPCRNEDAGTAGRGSLGSACQNRRRCRGSRRHPFSPWRATLNSMVGCSTRPVNFQALPSRFSRTVRIRLGSPLNLEPGRNPDLNIPTRFPVGAVLRRSPGQVCERSTGRRSSSLRLTRGERQQVVNQLTHAMYRCPYPAEEFFCLIVELVAIVGAQDCTVALDGPQWRTQIMGRPNS
jgi:hypothetical protein